MTVDLAVGFGCGIGVALAIYVVHSIATSRRRHWEQATLDTLESYRRAGKRLPYKLPEPHNIPAMPKVKPPKEEWQRALDSGYQPGPSDRPIKPPPRKL